MSLPNKAIIDLTDEDLEAIIRDGANYPYNREQARLERDYRSRNKNTKALNRWTRVIAIATILYSIATIALTLRALGVF